MFALMELIKKNWIVIDFILCNICSGLLIKTFYLFDCLLNSDLIRIKIDENKRYTIANVLYCFNCSY